jgi:hypothetical protein
MEERAWDDDQRRKQQPGRQLGSKKSDSSADGRGRKDHERVQLVVWTGGTCAGGGGGGGGERERESCRERAAVVRKAAQCVLLRSAQASKAKQYEEMIEAEKRPS